MVGILQFFLKRSEKYAKRTKMDLLGSNPLFYKVLSVDKKVFKIKRRRWN